MKRSAVTVLLAVSLVVNAGLIGIVGGRMLSGGRPAPAEMRFERYGPTSDVIQAAWGELPESDRQELRAQLREAWRDMAADRKRLQEAGRAVYEAALREPFDETRLRNELIVFQQREQMMQHRAEDILIRHLEGMPAQARATAAVGLLTPFNVRMQRRESSADGAPSRERSEGGGRR
jgi:uncharacterized membrane protein